MILLHQSWLEMKPNENEHGNQEWFDDYYKRIILKDEFNHIPKEVFEQWIHPHHKNYETLRNYAWIDYKNVDFVLTDWDLKQLSNIYVIQQFREYYKDRSSYNDLEQFCCIKLDLDHWIGRGTWRIPPIVIDLNTFNSPYPKWSELEPPYQLVEGHSRLGYLNSMIAISKLKKANISENHKIYLLRKRDDNSSK